MLEKFQREMFDRLLNGERVFYARLEGNKTALSDGYRIYVFDDGDLHIDISECKEVEGIAEYLAENEHDQKLSDTYTYIRNGKTLMHKFTAENKAFSVYVNEKFIKPTDRCPCSYYAYDGGARVAIKNIVTKNTIGSVMPCRYEAPNDLDN